MWPLNIGTATRTGKKMPHSMTSARKTEPQSLVDRSTTLNSRVINSLSADISSEDCVSPDSLEFSATTPSFRGCSRVREIPGFNVAATRGLGNFPLLWPDLLQYLVNHHVEVLRFGGNLLQVEEGFGV